MNKDYLILCSRSFYIEIGRPGDLGRKDQRLEVEESTFLEHIVIRYTDPPAAVQCSWVKLRHAIDLSGMVQLRSLGSAQIAL